MGQKINQVFRHSRKGYAVKARKRKIFEVDEVQNSRRVKQVRSNDNAVDDVSFFTTISETTQLDSSEDQARHPEDSFTDNVHVIIEETILCDFVDNTVDNDHISKTLSQTRINSYNSMDDDLPPSSQSTITEDLSASYGKRDNVNNVNLHDDSMGSNKSAVTNDSQHNTRKSNPNQIQDFFKIISGCRITNLAFFLTELINFGQHNPRNCVSRLTDLRVLKCLDRGLNCQLFIKCAGCGFMSNVYTNPPNSEDDMCINEAAVIAVLGSGSTFAAFKTILAAFDVPCLSPTTYRKYRKNFTGVLDEAVRKELRKNAEEEQRLAREANAVIDGTPLCTVLIDGTYAKRSYRTGKHNSLAGMVGIIGFRTQKVIDVVIWNKNCITCTRAEKRNKKPKPHPCSRNVDPKASSSSMEATCTVKAFKRSHKLNGLIYDIYVGDDDSSILSALRKANPYRDLNIEIFRIKCINHEFRSMGTKIVQASKAQSTLSTRGIIGKLRQKVKSSAIKIRKVISAQIERLQKDFDKNLSQAESIQLLDRNTEILRKLILIAPLHVFGDHEKCPQSWSCHKLKINYVPQLREFGLFSRVEKIMIDLSKDAEHLIHNLTSNGVEHLFSITAKYNNGKPLADDSGVGIGHSDASDCARFRRRK